MQFRLKQLVLIAALCATPLALQAQQFTVDGHTFQVHGYVSQGFVDRGSGGNNWLTMNTSDGSHVAPVLQKGGAAHEEFVKKYLGKTDDALQTFYRSLVFTGKGSMPKELGSDDEVVAYVAKTKGAIGYVSAGANAAGVKTLDVN